MTNITEMFEAPMQEIRHAYVQIDFVRPDGGLFTSEYDTLSAVDIGTINQNLADGYRIIAIQGR